MKDSWVLLLAASELLGGILVIIAYAFTGAIQPGYMAGWQNILALSFGGLSIYAGSQLFRGKRIGLRLSAILQLLQVVSISFTPFVRFVALSGLKARLIIASNGVHFAFGGGGEFIAIPRAQDGTLTAIAMALQFTMSIAADSLAASAGTFALNFVPIFFLWHLSEFKAWPAHWEEPAPLAAPEQTG